MVSCGCLSFICISIHALLAESELGRQSRRQDRSPISIHALLAESDQLYGRVLEPALEFLSTLSLRRATHPQQLQFHFAQHFYPRSPCGERRRSRPLPPFPGPYFYPRSPCGERLFVLHVVVNGVRISIHALLAESDACCRTASSMSPQFLSTLSLRRATPGWQRSRSTARRISIHALLAESDGTP